MSPEMERATSTTAPGGQGEHRPNVARGASGPAPRTPWGIWKDPDHMEEMGSALKAFGVTGTPWAEEARAWKDVQNKRSETGFLVRSLLLVHLGHRLALKTQLHSADQHQGTLQGGDQP